MRRLQKLGLKEEGLSGLRAPDASNGRGGAAADRNLERPEQPRPASRETERRTGRSPWIPMAVPRWSLPRVDCRRRRRRRRRSGRRVAASQSQRNADYTCYAILIRVHLPRRNLDLDEGSGLGRAERCAQPCNALFAVEAPEGESWIEAASARLCARAQSSLRRPDKVRTGWVGK